MNFRPYATSLLGVSMLALVACGDDAPKNDDTNPPIGNTDTGGDTGTSDPGPQVKRIAEMYFEFATGIDATTGYTAGATDDGNEWPSYIEVLFATAVWSGQYDDVNEYCTVILGTDGLPGAGWAFNAGYWFAYDYEPTWGGSDCEDFDFQELFGWDGLPEEFFGSLGWRVGVGGELDPAIESAIVNALGAEALPRYYGGGFEAWYLDQNGNEQIYLDSGAYTIGVRTNDNLEVVRNNDGGIEYILRDDASIPGGMATGYYVSYSWTYWTFQ